MLAHSCFSLMGLKKYLRQLPAASIRLIGWGCAQVGKFAAVMKRYEDMVAQEVGLATRLSQNWCSFVSAGGDTAFFDIYCSVTFRLSSDEETLAVSLPLVSVGQVQGYTFSSSLNTNCCFQILLLPDTVYGVFDWFICILHAIVVIFCGLSSSGKSSSD